MKRRLATFPLVLALVACSAVSSSPGSSPSQSEPSASSAQTQVPAGRILFMRSGSDGVEHYFTIKTDGTDEHAIFDREGCSCAYWSADGTLVLTLDDAGDGRYSFMTIRADGSDAEVPANPIETLNLAPGASTADGRLIVFAGWDEASSSPISGLYIGSPDLADLHQVLPLQEGWRGVEPIGITPDGSKVVFFAETGPHGETTHAGHIFVVNSDGTDLRQLNPPGTDTGSIGGVIGSLSPDGRQATFAVDNAVWVVDLAGGEARRITIQTSFFAWSASWSPTGEWITFTRVHGATHVIALVRPDGSDQKEISVVDESDEAYAAVWSPDGKYLLVMRDSDSTRDGPQDLWIMDLEGNYIGQVTHEPSNYGLYRWQPAATD